MEQDSFQALHMPKRICSSGCSCNHRSSISNKKTPIAENYPSILVARITLAESRSRCVAFALWKYSRRVTRNGKIIAGAGCSGRWRTTAISSLSQQSIVAVPMRRTSKPVQTGRSRQAWYALQHPLQSRQ